MRTIMPEVAAPVLYTEHIDGTGVKLFAAACKYDLEGIVAKRKDSLYECGERVTSCIKIKNPHLCRARHNTQIQGRHELFERRRQQGVCSGRFAPTRTHPFSIPNLRRSG